MSSARDSRHPHGHPRPRGGEGKRTQKQQEVAKALKARLYCEPERIRREKSKR